ncbi:hypothetical protein GCM10007940_23540 [Portibacter lacus]|uniref:DUF1833 domain-containing protein n=2 Tax=Portibacter lacus TaxID=1099794 RepID=A0AA37SQN9_9BACT|nr:hypothetical protein GCM10007940_23540 [Portibacter lacus]
MPLEVDFEIPPGLSGILTHSFVIQDIKNPINGFLSTFNVDTSQIKTIQAGRGELNARFGETNYQFIDRVSILLVDSDNPEIQREIYYLDFNSDTNNDTTLPLLSALSNVNDLMKKETFDLEIKLTFRSFSPRLIENRLIFNLQAFE